MGYAPHESIVRGPIGVIFGGGSGGEKSDNDKDDALTLDAKEKEDARHARLARLEDGWFSFFNAYCSATMQNRSPEVIKMAYFSLCQYAKRHPYFSARVPPPPTVFRGGAQ